jgi:hypothetical protein
MELGKSSHAIAQAIYTDLLTGKNCFKVVGHGEHGKWKKTVAALTSARWAIASSGRN